MILDVRNIVGMMGSVVLLISFTYSNLAKIMNLLLFNLLNLAGAAMLIVSLSVHFNIALMALEIVWAAVAFFGLARALVSRAPA